MIEEKAAFLRSGFFFHLDDLPSTEGETHLQILTHLIFKGLGCAKECDNLDSGSHMQLLR